MSGCGSGGKVRKVNDVEREVVRKVGEVERVQMGVYGVTGLYRT